MTAEHKKSDLSVPAAELAGLQRRMAFLEAALIQAYRADVALVQRGALPADLDAVRPKAPDAPIELAPAGIDLQSAEAWAHFDRLPDGQKQIARDRLRVLHAIDARLSDGAARLGAIDAVARERGVSTATIYNWLRAVAGADRGDWLPLLAPHFAGGQTRAELPDEAWQIIRADWLRPERPAFAACWRRLQAVARERGWTLPGARTVEHRLNALPARLRVLARQGEQALRRTYPAQQRDHGVFHALQAVNADGHRWDVFVRWPDGSIARPEMYAFQDLYSGKVLSWRVDTTLHSGLVRLAFGDVVDAFGIPSDAYLDNGREAAAKGITGGQPTRYRFKVREEDPEGLLTALGVRVHWTKPYHGQSKPIERAFRDFACDLARHPAFGGAYTGNRPDAKPENFGRHAVPLNEFLRVLSSGIAEHNARTGRRGGVCEGRSFDQVFAESYAKAPVCRASPAQRRLWLMAAEGITANRLDGSVSLLGNRFWAEFLTDLRGRKLIVRFDPLLVQHDLHVYRLDGTYLGAAPCVEAVGFNNSDAAREHARNLATYVRAARALKAAEVTLSTKQITASLPTTEEPPLPQAKLIRPLYRTPGAAALQVAPAEASDGFTETERAFVAGVRRLRLAVGSEDVDAD
jgi:hypothetical protein